MVSGWPVASTAKKERPGSAVCSALPSGSRGWGWGGSQLSLTVELLGNPKDPTPSPSPRDSPSPSWGLWHQKFFLVPRWFSEVRHPGNAHQSLPRACVLPYPRTVTWEQGSQPRRTRTRHNKQRQLQAGSRLRGLGHLQIRKDLQPHKQAD